MRADDGEDATTIFGLSLRRLREILLPPRPLLEQGLAVELRISLTDDGRCTPVLTEHTAWPEKPAPRERRAVVLLWAACDSICQQKGLDRRRVLLSVLAMSEHRKEAN